MNIAEEFNLDPETFVWQDLSLCANIPTEAYYDDADANDSIADATKSYCQVCPVKDMCAAFAVEKKAYGIHAGNKYERGKIVE
jgi:hypothetical protein